MTSTTTQTTTGSGDRTVHTRWLTVARVAMGLIGAQLLPGAVYFTFVAAPEDGGVVTAFDWFVAIWAMAAAFALLATALLPFPTPTCRLHVAWWVMGAHLVWALVKLVAYDEMPISAIVLLIDIVVLALLWLAGKGHTA